MRKHVVLTILTGQGQWEYAKKMVEVSIEEKLTQPVLFSRKYSYLAGIRSACGDLCNTERLGKPGMYFKMTTANVNCTALFQNLDPSRHFWRKTGGKLELSVPVNSSYQAEISTKIVSVLS